MNSCDVKLVEKAKPMVIGETEEHSSGALSGRYVYCVVDGVYPRPSRVGGIEGRPVYGIAYRGISAVVHKCSLKPYQSKDAAQVREWAVAHHHAVEVCQRRTGAVVPMAFDTIIKGGDDGVERWLKDDYERLRHKLSKVRGRAEYGVQIFWNPRTFSRRLIDEDRRLKELRLQQKKSGQGMAYILEKKIQRELERKLQKEAERPARDLYSKIAKVADAIHIDPVKEAGGEQMLMNLSVLLAEEKRSLIAAMLAEVREKDGFRVRLTGPWPPYSFV